MLQRSVLALELPLLVAFLLLRGVFAAPSAGFRWWALPPTTLAGLLAASAAGLFLLVLLRGLSLGPLILLLSVIGLASLLCRLPALLSTTLLVLASLLGRLLCLSGLLPLLLGLL